MDPTIATTASSQRRHGRAGIAAALLGLVAALGPATGLASTVIIDRFGPGNSYNASQGWSVGNSTFPPDFATAFLFPSGATGGYVDQITVALYGLYGINGGNHFRASIYLDVPDAGDPVLAPGALVASYEFAIDMYFPGVFTVQTPGNALLQPLALYWLAIEPVDSTQAAWLYNNQGFRGVRAHYDSPTNPGGWITYANSVAPAFRITANAPVPAPAAAWLLGAALAVLGGMRRRASIAP